MCIRDRHFAIRVKRLAGDDIAEQVATATELAWGRSPSKKETEQLTKLVRNSDAGLVGVCRVLFNTNEFTYVD